MKLHQQDGSRISRMGCKGEMSEGAIETQEIDPNEEDTPWVAKAKRAKELLKYTSDRDVLRVCLSNVGEAI